MNWLRRLPEAPDRFGASRRQPGRVSSDGASGPSIVRVQHRHPGVGGRECGARQGHCRGRQSLAMADRRVHPREPGASAHEHDGSGPARRLVRAVRRWGLLAATYVVTGMAGNIVSSVWAARHGTQLLSAGASGSIMGLLGMVAVLAWTADLKPLAKSLLRNAAFIVALGLALSVSGRGLIDNGAHVGGLLTGALIGWTRSRFRRPMPRIANRVLVGAAFALTLVAFGSIVAAGGTR